MGCYDTVAVPCPECGERYDAQSKGGECRLANYEMINCPMDVMTDINRHSPFECEKCGTRFEVRFVAEVIKVEGVSGESA